MKATELVHQYHAKTITARELVEGVWEKVENNRGTRRHPTPFLNGKEHRSWEHRFAEWDQGWKDSAEFTRDRIEKIRLVRKELFVVELQWSAALTRVKTYIGNGWNSMAFTDTVECVRWSRILAHLQAHLADLCVGIKPEVLK